MSFSLDNRPGEWLLDAARKIPKDDLADRENLHSLIKAAHQDFLMVAYSDLYPERTYLDWLHRIAYPIYLTTRHWSTVRRLALEAAHHQCALCGTEKRLEVHHKNYQCLGRERLADLTVLCRRCHGTYHGKPTE